MTEKALRRGIRSMTGFCRIAGRATESLAWTLTFKSVNHRYLDLHMRMPPGSESLEMILRRKIKESVVRGHLEVTLNLDRNAGSAIAFDETLIQSYVAAFRRAAAQNGLECRPDLNLIFRLPGVLTGETGAGEDAAEALERDVSVRIEEALASLNEMKSQEGAALAVELEASLKRLERCVDRAAGLRQNVQEAYFERISQRLLDLVNGQLDRDRVLQEAAMLAERSDVEEEITRLRTHIQHFRSMLDRGGEIGKKLDFLLQEMNREANTLLSKTGGVSGNGLETTELGLEMKSEIEKAREQVQNLE
jgi:uncharacterized protein (TIGR00255 family)